MTDSATPTDDTTLIASGTPKRPGAVRALIAIEDSEESWDAVEFAARLLKSDDETIVVNVNLFGDPLWIAAGGLLGYPVMYPGYTYASPAPMAAAAPMPSGEAADAEPNATDEALAERVVSEAAQIVEADATGVVRGDPVDRILEIAETNAVDLIVVGTRDPGLLSRIFTGASVSRDIVNKAPCSVLVVR